MRLLVRVLALTALAAGLLVGGGALGAAADGDGGRSANPPICC